MRLSLSVGNRVRPTNGFAHYIYLVLNIILAALVYVFVQVNTIPLAIAIVLLSKWRMFALRPRYWLLNLRSNAVDIMVGLSIIAFMTYTYSPGMRLLWAALYAGWLLLIKPRSSPLMVGLQALIGQGVGLWSLFMTWKSAPTLGLVAAVWIITYVSARHFFSAYDEARGPLFAYTWGYFGAALTWVLGHWLLFYGQLAQPTLFLSVLGFGMVSLYHLDARDRLSQPLRRQFVFIMVAIIAVVLVFSSWGDITTIRPN